MLKKLEDKYNPLYMLGKHSTSWFAEYKYLQQGYVLTVEN